LSGRLPPALSEVLSQAPTQPVFYYDLGSPRCYLLAERIMADLPVVPEWEPVLAADLGIREPESDRDALERLADERRMQPLRWPREWPPDARTATLAATYAKHIGRAVAFSLACFRQAFAGGRELGDESTVLIAAAACEMHPSAVLKGIGLRSVTTGLEHACARARDAGVTSLPAIQVGDRTFTELEDAAEALVEQPGTRR
jgi:2-hydroxychromene-2-carboxylate isomerase